jgi:hypothetical protein
MENKEPSFRKILKESLNSEGTNPGRVRLNPFRWTIMYPVKVLKLLVGLLISFLLTIKIHWIFSIMFIGFLLWNFIYWLNTFLRFKVGDVNPGKVIQLNPDRIAVATNMTKGFGNFPILKILDIKLRTEDRILNKIIPTIAGYTNNPYGYPFWSEFNPVPMNHGIRNQELIQYYSNTYGENEIRILNEYIDKVNSRNSETYKIDEETTDWINFKKVKIGDLDKMKGPEKLK